MGQGAAIRDRFANVASMEVVESSAGTLTFSSLATNLGFLGRRDQALAMAIDEIQYSPSLAGIALMTAQADHIQMGITTRNTVADLEDLTDTNLIDFAAFARQDFGTAAGGAFFEVPLRKQFFPPLITAERTLFLAVNTAGLGTIITVRARILYRLETLSNAELVEISEIFRLTG